MFTSWGPDALSGLWSRGYCAVRNLRHKEQEQVISTDVWYCFSEISTHSFIFLWCLIYIQCITRLLPTLLIIRHGNRWYVSYMQKKSSWRRKYNEKKKKNDLKIYFAFSFHSLLLSTTLPARPRSSKTQTSNHLI